MKKIFLLPPLIAIIASTPLSAESLFDGKSLDGWQTVVEKGWDVDGSTLFAVNEGVIHVYPTQDAGSKQPFGGIITQERYSDFHLTLEYKWGTKKFAPRDNAVRDAGIIFHIVGEPVIWPTGIECQIQEGDTGDVWIIGNTRASSPVHQVKKSFDSLGDLETRGAGIEGGRFPRGDCWEIPGWNKVEVIVKGDSAVYKVNGHTVNEVYKLRYNADINSDWSWESLREGRILLQAEGSELFYRNISIEELD